MGITQQYSNTALAFRAAHAANVKNTDILYGGSVINAYGDGASHPLSGLFPNLAAAQTVFPSAAALTDEIDYWVIQNYLVDGKKVYLPAGTYVLHGCLSIPNGLVTGLEMFGDGRGVTTITLRNSNQANASIICNADLIAAGFVSGNALTATPSYRLTIRDLTIDGNKANVGAPSPFLVYGIGLDAHYDLIIRDVEIQNVYGWGLHVQGNSSVYVQRGWYSNISAHDNKYWGIYIGYRYRKTFLSGLSADNNGTGGQCGYTKGGVQNINMGGIFLDCSEMQVQGIQAHANNGTGVVIRNVFGCQYSGIRATYNGGCGIQAYAMVDCLGSDWVALNNGTNPGNGQINTTGGGGANTATGGYDIYFDDSTYGGPGYGITNNTIVRGIRCGVITSSTWPGAETYGLYVDDGIAPNTLRLRNINNTSSSRLPSSTSTVSAFDPYYTKITATGTWTVPATGTYRVRAVAAGGGGGGGNGAQASQSGGGGGAAGLAAEQIAVLNTAEAYTVTIGAGGTSGAVGAAGGQGGTSSFAGTSLNLYASGGGGGAGAAANSTAVSSGGVPGIQATGAQLFAGFGGTSGNASGGALPHGSIGGGSGTAATASAGGNGGGAGAYTAARTAAGSGNTGTTSGGNGASAASNTGHGGGGGGGAFTGGTGGTGGVGGSGYVEIWQIA